MTRDLEKQVRKELQTRLTQHLSQAGFRRTGNGYKRTFGGVSHVVDVQYSKWKNPNKVSFTLNCGVYVPRVVSVFHGTAEPLRPKLTDCCVYVRGGMLTDEKLDTWWSVAVEKNIEVASASSAAEAMIKQHILPFLERFAEPADVAEFLSSHRCVSDTSVEPRADAVSHIYAAILWRTAGGSERCREMMDTALREAARTPLADVVAKFAARFACCDPSATPG